MEKDEGGWEVFREKAEVFREKDEDPVYYRVELIRWT
jgi:hypothetical protein